mgnify:FL=1
MIIANSGRIYTCFSSTRQVNPGRIVLDTPPVKNIRDWNTWVNGQNGNQLDEIKQPFTKLHEQAIFSSRRLFCRFKQTTIIDQQGAQLELQLRHLRKKDWYLNLQGWKGVEVSH